MFGCQRAYRSADGCSCSCSFYVGMHYPESRFYIRRVRMASDADVLRPLREAGYRCAECVRFSPIGVGPSPPRLLFTQQPKMACSFALHDVSSDLLNPLPLRLEPAAENPEGTMVVEVPVDAGEGVRTAQDLSMWEQLSFAAFLQRYWADNQASFLCFGALTLRMAFWTSTRCTNACARQLDIHVACFNSTLCIRYPFCFRPGELHDYLRS